MVWRNLIWLLICVLTLIYVSLGICCWQLQNHIFFFFSFSFLWAISSKKSLFPILWFLRWLESNSVKCFLFFKCTMLFVIVLLIKDVGKNHSFLRSKRSLHRTASTNITSNAYWVQLLDLSVIKEKLMHFTEGLPFSFSPQINQQSAT